MYGTPGVYFDETPRGPRPIVGAATANTGFVGTFARGPVQRAMRIGSLAEAERIFGGLHPRSETSYALRAFFLNGGRAARVVRVTGSGARPARLIAGADTVFAAASPGRWGNGLRIGIAHDGSGGPVALLVREVEPATGRVLAEEAFVALSADPADPRHMARVLGEVSSLARVEAGGAALPPRTTVDGVGMPTLDSLRAVPPEALIAPDPDDAGEDGTMETDPGWAAEAAAVLLGSEADGTGIHALAALAPEPLNLLCLPGAATSGAVPGAYAAAHGFCRDSRAVLLVDPPPATGRDGAASVAAGLRAALGSHAAFYFPRLVGPDPLDPAQPRSFGPSGAVAGQIAATDAARGVWTAPAGTATRLLGAAPVERLDDRQQEPLAAAGVNVIRSFGPLGSVIWGARTLAGDGEAREWRQLVTRRMALHIEQSLRLGLGWTVFEPNGAALWSAVRSAATAFLDGLMRRGAFAGRSAAEAFFVQCDATTTTAAEREDGIVCLQLGFAPLRPAEFVVLHLRLGSAR